MTSEQESDGSRDNIVYELGEYQGQVDMAMAEVRGANIVQRIWDHDHTVWKPEPTEITNRLGWLHSPAEMKGNVGEIEAFVKTVGEDGIRHVLVLGMGGSSLAPEVFSKTFGGDSDDGITLGIVDTTDPDAISALGGEIDPAETLFIVSTKSGGTVETLSAFKHFYNLVLTAVGEEQAGRHFAAITDPGSKLVTIAEQYRFRATFLNDPNIGGRYSVLSYFGLVPASLVGVDIGQLLERAEEMADEGRDDCATLGTAIGELAKAGRDKVTLVSSEEMTSFGDWVEQLVAESTGKEGKGILPIVGEPLGDPEVYGDDRLFVFTILPGDEDLEVVADAMRDAGHPVIHIYLNDAYDMGGLYFLWELATAVASQRLGINPFDQPDVESAKVRAREVVDEYGTSGKLPDLVPAFELDSFSVYGDVASTLPKEALEEFLESLEVGSYISLQAYVDPTPETYDVLAQLAATLRDKTRAATTIGFGPRFLHSTGQLHKGDSGKGHFVQIVSEPAEEVPIPDDAGSAESSMGFGVLKLAQALGDRQALLDSGRKVIQYRCAAADVQRLLGVLM